MIPFSDLDERALKTMTGELVSLCGGTRAVGALLGAGGKPFSEARVSGYCNLSDMTRFMPVRAVTKLEIAAGVPLVSRWMTERISRAPGSAGSLCIQDLCHILREASELQSAVGEAFADGHVDSADRATIRSALSDLRVVLADLETKVAQP